MTPTDEEWARAQQPKWISLEEKFPNDGETVLVAIVLPHRNIVTEAFHHYHPMHEKKWIVLSQPDFDYGYKNVTHWMPLPEPPKQNLPMTENSAHGFSESHYVPMGKSTPYKILDADQFSKVVTISKSEGREKPQPEKELYSIKPLDWDERSPTVFKAVSGVFSYSVEKVYKSNKWRVWAYCDGGDEEQICDRCLDTDEEGKRQALEHFKERLKTCLILETKN